jgi:hypothetical protein
MQTAARADSLRRGATVLCANVAGGAMGEPITLYRRRCRLSAVVKRYVDQRRPYIVSVHRPGDVLRPEDHTVVARETWSKTLVAHDSIILITHMPLGNGQTGKQIGAAVAMLVLAFAAPYAVAGLGIGALGTLTAAGVPSLTFAGSLLALGITVAGGYRSTQRCGRGRAGRQTTPARCARSTASQAVATCRARATVSRSAMGSAGASPISASRTI